MLGALGNVGINMAISTLVKGLSPEQRESAKEMVGKLDQYLPMIPDTHMLVLYKEKYEAKEGEEKAEESIFAIIIEKEKIDINEEQDKVNVFDIGQLIKKAGESL